MHNHHNTEDFAVGFLVGQSTKSNKNPDPGGSGGPITLMIVLGIVIGLLDFVLIPIMWSGSMEMFKYSVGTAFFCLLFTLCLFVFPFLALSLAIYWIKEERRQAAQDIIRWREQDRLRKEKDTADLVKRKKQIEEDLAERELFHKNHRKLMAQVAEIQQKLDALELDISMNPEQPEDNQSCVTESHSSQ